MKNYDLIRQLTKKEAKIFDGFYKQYAEQCANKSVEEIQELCDQKALASQNYEANTQSEYEKFDKLTLYSGLAWTGIIVGGMVVDMACGLDLTGVAVFTGVGATAVASILYCSTKQLKILRNRISNSLEELAIINVLDDKTDGMILQATATAHDGNKSEQSAPQDIYAEAVESASFNNSR